MYAVFHCLGTLEVDRDKFIMSAIGSAKTGAPILKNQADMLSRPIAVRFKLLSSSRNTRHSVANMGRCVF